MTDLSRGARLDHALELLYFGFKRLVEAPDRRLAGRGLARMHHRILYFVARAPGLSVSDLLGALDLTKQSVNAPLRTLVERGLVHSLRDDADRRIRRLTVSPAGARLEAALTGLQHRTLARVFRAAGHRSEAGWRVVMAELGRRPAGGVDQ